MAKVVCTIGKPNKRYSATMDVYNDCTIVDIGKMIQDELEQIGEVPAIPWLPELPNGYYLVHEGIPVVLDGVPVVFYE